MPSIQAGAAQRRRRRQNRSFENNFIDTSSIRARPGLYSTYRQSFPPHRRLIPQPRASVIDLTIDDNDNDDQMMTCDTMSDDNNDDDNEDQRRSDTLSPSSSSNFTCQTDLTTPFPSAARTHTSMHTGSVHSLRRGIHDATSQHQNSLIVVDSDDEEEAVQADIGGIAQTSRVAGARCPTRHSHITSSRRETLSTIQSSSVNTVYVVDEDIDADTNRDEGEDGSEIQELPTILVDDDDDDDVDSMFANMLQHMDLDDGQLSSISTISSFKPNAWTVCEPGHAVELDDRSFMRIEFLYRDRDVVFLVGKLLVRQNSLKGHFSLRRNELVWKIVDGAKTSVVRPVSKVIRNRQIVFTNRLHPLVSTHTDANSFSDRSEDARNGPLFCRWKRRVVLVGGKVVEESFEYIRQDEADDSQRLDKSEVFCDTNMLESELRNAWRGRTDLGGGYQHATERDYVDLESGDSHVELHHQRSYTFIDGFCGAGGVSQGALTAGLKLICAFDYDEQAANTYSSNFSAHGARIYCQAAHDFILSYSGGKVDVLHLSPPCQPFSPAHTIASMENDERNEAALFSVQQMLELLRPRIVTMEETFGLKTRHGEWFTAIINIFTSLNYSVKWKILKCAEYGVPQTRTRLVIVAAGPGEKLPPFPNPTHGPGLKPIPTINSTLRQIPRNATWNDPSSMQFRDGPRQPYRGDILANTLTCSGGIGNYHPSGLRPYTIRELASLQTFPHNFSFAGANRVTAARRQVGNAVPPVLAEAMFRTIITALKEADGVA